jgi:hypothetical protein
MAWVSWRVKACLLLRQSREPLQLAPHHMLPLPLLLLLLQRRLLPLQLQLALLALPGVPQTLPCLLPVLLPLLLHLPPLLSHLTP